MSKSEQRTAEIDATFRTVYTRDRGKCVFCHEPANRYGTMQLAHRIPQSKANLRKYGAAVIHHPLNVGLTCCLECNAAIDVRNHPIEIAALVKKIKEALHA